MKTSRKIAVVTALSGLFMLAAGTVGPTPGQTSAQPPAPPWSIEFEDEIRRDVRALATFVVHDLGPVVGRQKDGAAAVEGLRPFVAVLDGCAGAPGLPDYAWALNETLAASLPLFTALEVMIEREQNFPAGPESAARVQSYQTLMQGLERHYGRGARWLWDINAAFAQKLPDAAARVERLREEGVIEGGLHRGGDEGADIYTDAHPFAGTAPLRNRAAIFAPYALPRPSACR